MWTDLPLFPLRASTIAGGVDALYFYLVAVSVFFSVLIFLTIFFLAVKYRRRRADEVPRPIDGSTSLEIVWSLIPLALAMVMFFWGAGLYFRNSQPPPGALEINVIGKQWMWKLQHAEGRREINELHVPVGRPVRLVMTSQDVIHSFYVPAFRIKQDVLPGRYTTAWFEATRAGEYHLFCAEYCGTQHSGMIGRVVVLEPAQYEEWLAGAPAAESLVAAGERLFQRYGCINCHTPEAGRGRCPVLIGVYGKPVPLASGQIVTADEAYLRESILNPRAKVVAGYSPIMPTFQGQLNEEQLLEIIAYLKSLERAPEGEDR
jgi:cytochrome c oxidase subunit 2